MRNTAHPGFWLLLPQRFSAEGIDHVLHRTILVVECMDTAASQLSAVHPSPRLTLPGTSFSNLFLFLSRLFFYVPLYVDGSHEENG